MLPKRKTPTNWIEYGAWLKCQNCNTEIAYVDNIVSGFYEQFGYGELDTNLHVLCPPCHNLALMEKQKPSEGC